MKSFLRDEMADVAGIGSVRMVQSSRARRVSVSVNASGCVRLTYPRGVSRARAAEFLVSRTEWIAEARRRMAVRAAARPAIEYTPEQIEDFRRRAHADLPPRVEALARSLGLTYGRLTIRASRSKWGSCSSRNDLSLSLFMMLLPERLRDYVIVHELCHTVHHDHSARFHALVDRCLSGREKELNRELRQYRIR